MNAKLTPKMLVGIAAILVASCAPVSDLNYQVVSVRSPILSESGNNLMYENEDLRLRYDLWGNWGQLRYRVYNKTGEILYIDLKRSFFVKNGFAYDYYVNKTETVSRGTSQKEVDMDIDIEDEEIEGVSHSRSGHEETTIKAPAKIAIPPGASKELAYFNVRDHLFTFCELPQYPDADDTARVAFNSENTPFVFENHLTYSLDQALTNPENVRNRFWVGQVENINGSNFLKEKELQEPCDSTETYEVEVTEEEAKNRFYIEFEDEGGY